MHHEKVDGSGYPYGLKGDEIMLPGRIIAVADVYDALTSYRPYRTPMQPAEAVEYIMGNIGVQFDYDVVIAFLHKLELYPVGGFILLSNGKSAVVLDNQNSLRPIVRLLDTGDILDLFTDRKCLSLTITKSIDFGEAGIITA
jgi:HD-GYP domain-containing protein (c-di-GMP phosphodiesterase class II)